MITKNTTILMLTVLAAITVAVTAATGTSFAEIPESLHDEAIEGKEIWGTLETLRNQENRTADDEQRIATLQVRYDEIVAMMNEYNVPSPQQWAENEAEWVARNAPPDNSEEDRQTMAMCGCTKALKFIAGFEYKKYGYWPVIKLSNGGWESLTSVDQSETSTVRADKDYDHDIRPLALMKLTAQGQGRVMLDPAGYDEAGNPIYDPRPVTKTVTAVTPFNQYHWFPIFGTADRGDEIDVEGTLRSLH